MKLQSIIHQPNLASMVDLVSSLPAGPFAEVGVFHGGSAQVLYSVAIAQGRELHLFDTFTGIPYSDEKLDRHKVGEFADKNAPAHIRDAMPKAILHIGIYPDTHPQDLKDIAFVHCDCDQYLSYRAVIDTMWPLMRPKGIMLFDDYPYLQGAKQAVEESFFTEDLQPCGSRWYVTKGIARDK